LLLIGYVGLDEERIASRIAYGPCSRITRHTALAADLLDAAIVFRRENGVAVGALHNLDQQCDYLPGACAIQIRCKHVNRGATTFRAIAQRRPVSVG
jgi:hypothetical protein